jgi:hypothetical protein
VTHHALHLCTCPDVYHAPTTTIEGKTVCARCEKKIPGAVITLRGVDSTAKERNDERREKGYRR